MRAGIYARVSSEDQQERGTIENQIEFAKKYCDLHEIQIEKWYLDDGISGTISLEMREAAKKMLEDAKEKKFDLLLIYRLDRLGRSARIILNAVYELEQHGIKIRSMTEPFDTGDPNGRFLLTILAGVADLERETILERMWHGANRAARAGKWIGGIVPYGYKVNDEGYLEINEDKLPGIDMSEVEVIKLIYNLTVNQNMSTIKISDYLNALNIPPSYTKDGRMVKKGKRKENTAGIWRPSRVLRILKNTTYKGIHYYGKRSNKKRELISREVPAIVDELTWEKAQKVIQSNQLISMRNSKHPYLLRGLIKCGECGLSYGGAYYSGPGGKPKYYYVCGGKTAYRGPKQGKCKSKNVPRDWIEEIVWNNIIDFINNPGDAMKELASSMKIRKSRCKEYEGDKSMVIENIKEKESEKQSILDLYRKKLIGSLDVEQQLQKISREKSLLEQRVENLDKQILVETSFAQNFDTAEDLLCELKEKISGELTVEAKKEIINILVDEIIVNTKYNDNGRPWAEVTIRYTFSRVVNCTDKD